MLSLFYSCLLLTLFQCVCRAELCTWPCVCARAPLQCAAGVSRVLDGCGCCKSCARQIGESCNERDVCDPHKGMYCDFSRDKPQFKNGVCAYLLAVGCDLNGVHYENGEAFQPSPLYKCVCIAGSIGCTPAFIQKPVGLQHLGPASLRAKQPQDTTYRTMSAYRDPPSVWRRNCLVQTSPWSSCSRTCDLGVSVRISNSNSKCEMRKERRLCLLRPCNTTLKNLKIPAGKTCKPMFQAEKAKKLSLSGCTSVKKYRPTFCGVCSDQRCCIPNKSTAVQVQFQCSGGTIVHWNMQWITSCVCQRKCEKPGDLFSELYLL
ncbi:cellular communication network factor 6 [Hoplias malabaricus]|uniref:cellular communication network factor 6 n=1 Tax=Hoplias malabaricus TaxID=27720 RepID=UPI003461DEB3